MPSLIAWLPMNSIWRILTFGPSFMLKVTCTSFGPPGTSLISCVTSARWKPFSFIMSRTIAFDLADQRRVDEGVEPDLRVRFLQLLVDLRGLDLLRADVVDDLDALPLLHVVGDQLADHAVREHVVVGLDREVVEEVGGPQPLEVVADDLSISSL